MIAGLMLLHATLAISVAGPATSPEYLPLHVASAEGYFAEEKLDVTVDTARAGAAAAQALARGHAALAATSLDTALSLGHVSGMPPRLIFGLTAAPPVVLLVLRARSARFATWSERRSASQLQAPPKTSRSRRSSPTPRSARIR